MNIGQIGVVVPAAAGSSLAQARGSDAEKVGQDISAQQRQTDGTHRANQAAGVAEADGQDHQAHERDADGRRLWEEPLAAKSALDPHAIPELESPTSKDATGECGHQLDLSG